MLLEKLSLPDDIAAKLQQLAFEELRPIKFQAEYMLCRAVRRARVKSASGRESQRPEVLHAPAP